MNKETQGSLWVVSEEMGYGHLRAAFPFAEYAEEGILSISSADYTSTKIRKRWSRAQRMYEFVSRNKNTPVIGKRLFRLMNHLLKIPPYYPIKDRSHPTFQVRALEKYLNAGLYDALLQKIDTKKIPFLTTFYAPAIAADRAGFKNVYCVITDTDANRVWVPRNPGKSRIKYLVPSRIAYGRLLQYGVAKKNIIYTGFPISDILMGGKKKRILKEALSRRLRNLDPNGAFGTHFGADVKKEFGFNYLKCDSGRPLTITFAVGGAGAQKETAAKILAGLKQKIADGKAAVNLVAGTRKEVRDYFNALIRETESQNVRVIYAESKEEYFRLFDETMLDTDILWTKPSELSFYAGLGIPVILSPSIGAQEEANRRWLRDDIGAGIVQRKTKYCGQWIDDFLDSGKFAEAAWLGYLKIKKTSVRGIVDLIEKDSR
jgi:hypothetical protein